LLLTVTAFAGSVLNHAPLAAMFYLAAEYAVGLGGPACSTCGSRLARASALGVAERVAGELPDTAATDVRKSKRGSRVYIDVMQKARGHHAVPPYVLRPTPGVEGVHPPAVGRADAQPQDRPGPAGTAEGRPAGETGEGDMTGPLTPRTRRPGIGT
jgi:hypothetical protein